MICELGINLDSISKKFDSTSVLKGIDLEIYDEEFFTLLGPSGCGKTTLLRILAGLELPNSGSVFLDNINITKLPANKRQINTVFQSYALFPHLNVFENIAFGLKCQKKKDIERKVYEKLELLDLSEQREKRIEQLSGGQKQRVALARALVNEPKVLLLDEPMSALDARLRTSVQESIRRIQKLTKTTFILVTHDQDEAMIVSDRIALMKDGKIEQLGRPSDVYSKPKSRFVAEFLGASNIISVKKNCTKLISEFGELFIKELPEWTQGEVSIRPECIKFSGSLNKLSVKIDDIIYRGNCIDIFVSKENLQLKIKTDPRDFTIGSVIDIYIPDNEIICLEAS